MDKMKDRLPYSPIVDRPPLTLPDGKRMAVWVIVNVEEWDSAKAMPRVVLSPPMGDPLLPDLPNWAWHEYGNRVGFWRIRDALKKIEAKATFAMNGVILESYKPIAEAALEDDWEFMGHGFVQGPMHRLENQAEAIGQTVDAIKSFTGKPPRGWESPGLTENLDTLDLLAEAGIEYVADWVLDDQPVVLQSKSGPVISVPYTVETNDITMMALQHHSASEFLQRGKDQFDRLYQESADITRVMAISLHTYISGVPHRICYVEELFAHIRSHDDVAIWKGEEIMDWYKSQTN
ncbi:MAG: polysaccharide deacetylase family protein [Proteobacteria bacterium]|nr:polysaccharide deacetylase family protein [Pseudomonadota bacterium]